MKKRKKPAVRQVFFFLLNFFSKFINEFFGLFPAEAGVGDRFSVNSTAGFLAAVFDITFDHEAFYHFCNVAVIFSAVHNFVGNSDLFEPLFSGVGMVAVNNNGGVFEIPFVIKIENSLKVFVMIVRVAVAVFVNIAAENCMGKRVAFALNFPAAVNKVMGNLGGGYGVHHNGKVAAGGVFHSDRNVDSAGGEAVVLVFNRTRTHRNISEKIGKREVVFGI